MLPMTEEKRQEILAQNKTMADKALRVLAAAIRLWEGGLPKDESPEYLEQDLKTFGFIFECLCIRDLKVYSPALGGKVSYYHDRSDLEADCVLHLSDGRYALIEFKLSSCEIEEGAQHLLQIKQLVRTANASGKTNLREPDLLMVITGGELAYTRPDGVKIIPIGCLRD